MRVPWAFLFLVGMSISVVARATAGGKLEIVGRGETAAQVDGTPPQAAEFRLEREAQAKAWRDAKEQMRAYAIQCGLGGVRLSEIGPPSLQTYVRAPQDLSGGAAPADEQVVEAAWKFTWSFESSDCPVR